MALMFFAINMSSSARSTRLERQMELDEEFRIALASEYKKLDELLNAGWVVVASYTVNYEFSGLMLHFILHKADES